MDRTKHKTSKKRFIFSLFLVYTFLGNYYKIPLNIDQFTKDLDYTLINFYKIYHIICTEPDGFIKWVEKNRYMEVKIGHFETSDEAKKKTEVKNILKRNIVIQDNDICEDIQNFVPVKIFKILCRLLQLIYRHKD